MDADEAFCVAFNCAVACSRVARRRLREENACVVEAKTTRHDLTRSPAFAPLCAALGVGHCCALH
jgi:hypothetical protein